MTKTARSGFTLIELLVVIAVIGLLAGALIVFINPVAQLKRARDADRKNDIRVIRQALEEYFIINGSYPVTSAGWVTSQGGDTWIPGLNSAYLKAIPVDPLNNGCCAWEDTPPDYSYGYNSSNGTIYDLVAQLENKQDPDRCEVKQYYYLFGEGGWCNFYSFSIYLYAKNSRDL